MNILSETDSLLILKSVSPYSEHFDAANGVHYMESLLYYIPTRLLYTIFGETTIPIPN